MKHFKNRYVGFGWTPYVGDVSDFSGVLVLVEDGDSYHAINCHSMGGDFICINDGLGEVLTSEKYNIVAYMPYEYAEAT